MKKTSSMYGRVPPKKQPETKSTSSVKKTGVSQGNGVGSITPSAAAKDRRSPVVADHSIATNSVIQAANDPKIKELVIKQQLMDRKQRESVDKKRPRADGTTGTFLTLEHSSSFNSGHHGSHSGQFYYKHSSFDDTSPSGEHHHDERGLVKCVPSSPDAHHHYQYGPQIGATPGSFSDTVVANSEISTPNGGGIAQLDDVNSEITADAGYMTMQKGQPMPITHMEGIPSAGVSPNNVMMATSPHMNVYMDMNASLLHDPHQGANHNGTKGSGPQASPHNIGVRAHLPSPPPMALPQAMHAPSAVNNNAHAHTQAHSNQIPARVHTAYEAAMVDHHDNYSAAPVLPDPKQLDDSALQAAYFKFLLEMETRGLQAMSLNGPMTASAPPVPPLHASGSGIGGAAGAVNVVGTGNSTRTPSPSLSSSPSTAQFLATHIPESERSNSRAATGSSAGIAAKTTPSTAHNAVPASATPNPADIRKHVKRSKSGGSESSFYPTSLFPGGPPVPSQVNTSVPPVGSSGRRTPNSPMMNRHIHSTSGEFGSYEPEDLELKDAFGQSRYPGSPSNPFYSGQSPSYLSSNAPAPTYYAQHHSLTITHAHTGVGNHSHGTTPTSIAVGSATWVGQAPGPVPAAHTATTLGSAANNTGHGHHGHSRSASRCSGVAPPLACDGRDELLELRPAVRSNCLSTLPATYHQYMYTSAGQSAGAQNGTASASTATAAASGNESVAASSRVDLKTPRFVRKLQEGMGAALLGLTGNSNREDDANSLGDSSASSWGRSTNTAQSQAPHAQGGAGTGGGAVHGSKSGASAQKDHRGAATRYTDADNSIDAVKAAGGLDQLLLPGRALIRGGSLIPDDHSAFSHGSMSLSSVRSNGKKSSKTRS